MGFKRVLNWVLYRVLMRLFIGAGFHRVFVGLNICLLGRKIVFIGFLMGMLLG